MSDFFDTATAQGFIEHMIAREERLWARFRANLKAAEEAMKAAEAEPFVVGSTGQPVEHPASRRRPAATSWR